MSRYRSFATFALVSVFFLSAHGVLYADLVLDLADVVGGGDGTGTGTDSGIDIETGLAISIHASYLNVPTNFFVTSANPFVDGVFVPDGDSGTASFQVTSTGITVSGVSDTASSPTWDHIWNGNNNGVSTNFSGPIIGAHASKGITFDLNAMEAANPGMDALSYDITAGTGLISGAQVDFYLFVDGNLAHSVSLDGSDQSFNFAGSFNQSDRFLTLITSPRGVINQDWSVWSNPSVTLGTAVPEPASVAILFAGMATLFIRRKWSNRCP